MRTIDYPFTYKVIVFPLDADKRDLFLSTHSYESIINNESDERKFFESFDGDENVIIVKL
jgi:hypothetical protein